MLSRIAPMKINVYEIKYEIHKGNSMPVDLVISLVISGSKVLIRIMTGLSIAGKYARGFVG